MASTTFPRFLELPTELQIIIWKAIDDYIIRKRCPTYYGFSPDDPKTSSMSP